MKNKKRLLKGGLVVKSNLPTRKPDPTAAMAPPLSKSQLTISMVKKKRMKKMTTLNKTKWKVTMTQS
jgi:hypothetical protein